LTSFLAGEKANLNIYVFCCMSIFGSLKTQKLLKFSFWAIFSHFERFFLSIFAVLCLFIFLFRTHMLYTFGVISGSLVKSRLVDLADYGPKVSR
jgi:uncharacterized membrane protein YesL